MRGRRIRRTVSEREGELRVSRFKSKTFGDMQTLRIWLPPGYALRANLRRRYPVLYMFDGQNLFEAGAQYPELGWRIDATLAGMIEANIVQPAIVVGIDSPGSRRAEQYLPYADTLFAAQIEPLGRFMPAFLAGEVLPRISRRFRVTREASETGIGGSSYGAVAALYSLMRRPDLFGLGLLESAALQVGNGQLLRDLTPVVAGPRRVYVGVGGNEIAGNEERAERDGFALAEFNRGFVELSRRLAATLDAAIVNRPKVMFVEEPEATHDERAWSRRFPAAMQFLFGT